MDNKYIATKPVRFDRDYGVGEAIPNAVINPKMAKRLIEAGRIAPMTTADNIYTEPQLFGGSLEQSVALIEDILEIDRDDQELPDLEARARICKEIIVEIKNTVSFLKAQDEKHEGSEPNAPLINLFGWDMRKSVESMERLLGISHGDNPSSLEERAEVCRTRMEQINEQGYPVYRDDKLPEDDGTQPPAAAQETPPDAQNGEGGTNQGADAQPQDGAENATGAVLDSEISGGASLTCDICGKVCGSRAALTTHMKTHENK